MKIGLIQIDGKLPNLALMKVSSFYKSQGCHVEFANRMTKYDKVYIASIFTWNKERAESEAQYYDCDVLIGGTGYDLTVTLPDEIEKCQPDYNLYTLDHVLGMNKSGAKKKAQHLKDCQTILDMGIGFTSRGCVRNCEFCFVPKKEGLIRQDSSIEEIINPRSNIITLFDNNMTADPLCIEKLTEINERNLIVDLSQGIDIRLMTEEKAIAFGQVRHLKSLHYSWDLMEYEKPILEGIQILSKGVKPYRQMCYVLCGFNTTFEEDFYRVEKLISLGVNPYVMVYNKRTDDARLNHFKRWVNGRIYKSDPFSNYKPYKKYLEAGNGRLFKAIQPNKTAH